MTPVHRNLPAAVLLACCCATGTAAPQAPSPRSAPGADAALDRVLSDAIAGPLVAALSEQFGGRAVDMRLQAVQVDPVDTGASAITGTGDVRIDERSGWVGFAFRMPYDPRRRPRPD